mgnify:CR=1 FL=1
MLRAYNLTKAGAYVEAEEEFKRAAFYSPRWRPLHFNLGVLAEAAGELVAAQGGPADRLFLVESGRLDAHVAEADGARELLSSVGPGEHLGEMALNHAMLRLATITAREATRGWVLRADDFAALRAAQDPGALKVLLRLARLLCARRRLRTQGITGVAESAEAPEGAGPEVFDGPGPAEPVALAELRVLEFFRDFADAELTALRGLLRRWQIPRGRRVTTAGTAGSSACVIASGAIEIEVTRIASESTLAKVIKLVSEAETQKSPTQRFTDRFERFFVPAVLGLSGLLLFAWVIVDEPFRDSFYRAMAVLVAASPCALAIATPSAVLSGVARAARCGVLVKGGAPLELLGSLDAIAFDKTGTLTEGKPRLVAVETAAGFDEAQVLRVAAALEKPSEHPLAMAILAGARKKDIAVPHVSDFQAVAGKGVTGQVDGMRIAVGNEKLLSDSGISSGPLARPAAERRAAGEAVIFVAIDGVVAGLVVVADSIKDTAQDALAELRREGLRIIMLTGDHRGPAESVARKLQIDEVIADVLPTEKGAAIERLRKEGRVVAMAGDGVNDAPALAAADVGIAMGSGTDVAIESAAVTLVKGDLRGILRARRLSRATVRNIRQNLFFAFVYNLLGVPLAAGALYPFLGIVLSPMVASGAMSLSSVSVIANALRLRKAAL